VIFEDILIAAADARYPDPLASSDYQKIEIPQLGLTADWAPVHDGRALIEDASNLLEDKKIKTILRRVPVSAREYALFDVAADVLLMREYSAPLVSSRGRILLAERLVELGVVPSPGAATAPERLLVARATSRPEQVHISPLVDYVDVVGLAFKSGDVASLNRVKETKVIRHYSSQFQRVLTDPATADPESFYDAIATAWQHRAVSSEVSHAFAASTRGLAILSLIPFAGTAAGVGSLASDAVDASLKKDAARHAWYELGPEIQKVESLNALQTRMFGSVEFK